MRDRGREYFICCFVLWMPALVPDGSQKFKSPLRVAGTNCSRLTASHEAGFDQPGLGFKPGHAALECGDGNHVALPLPQV